MRKKGATKKRGDKTTFEDLLAPLNYVSNHPADADPSEVFHYTTAIDGILKDDFIRASHYRTLNDTSEYTYARKRAAELMDEFGRSGKTRRLLAASIARALDAATSPELFVASFSEKSDLLSMWRGYTKDERARFAIGLRIGRLDPEGEDGPVSLGGWSGGRVAYRASRQRRWILRNLDEIADALADEHLPQIDQIGRRCATRALAQLPFLKHSYFREEREWRAVLDCPDFSQTHVAPESNRAFLQFSPR